MKKLLLLTLLIVSPLMGQESTTKQGTNTSVLNNSLKLYLMAGLPAGIGLTYTGEVRADQSSPTIHAFNLDFQMIAIENTPVGFHVLGGHLGFQYSIGRLLQNGSRFYVDLVGVGVNVISMFGLRNQDIYYSIKLLGFQNTLSNGFYWGIRTALTLQNFDSVYKYNGNPRVGFGAYLALGYDFGKKINPRDYESRMR